MAVAAQLLVTGRIATLDGPTGFGWVEALAIGHGRILAAGRLADVEALVGARTRRLMLPPDAVALPGLVDAHLHLVDAALAARHIDLEGASFEDALGRIGAAAAGSASGSWVQGAGWDPATFGRWPTAADLEGVAPARDVLLWSHDRHAVWVSEGVLGRAGVVATTDDPTGGAIRRDASGAATGILHETAVQFGLAVLPSPTVEELAEAMTAYARELVRLGLVGAHDPGDLNVSPTAITTLTRLSESERLPIRVHRSVRAAGLEHAIEGGLRTGDRIGADPVGRLRMGWLKLFTDGALGSRTALMLEPFEGDGGLGIAVTGPAELARLAGRAAAAGIVPQIHAIGDAALRHALDALEPVAPQTGPMARVEHVQVANERDLPRFAAARIGASIQPIHLRTDREKAHAAWGKARAERDSFRLSSLIDAGATIAFGTDAPVEPADPWPGIALAVTRVASSWPDHRPFAPSEAIDLAAALRAATIGPATLAGDPIGGRLLPGSRADLIVLPAAVLDDPVEPGGALERARPSFVMIDGEVVFQA